MSIERVFHVEDVELGSLSSFDDGFLAGGCRLSQPSVDGGVACEEALVLRSHDGRAWSEVLLPGAEGRRITTVAWTPFGVLALGVTVVDEPPAHRVAWRSVDGTTWVPFAIPVPETIGFEQVVVLRDRTVFLGLDHAHDFAVSDIAWTTVDGVAWTSGTTPIGPKLAAHPGIVAAGSECVDVCETDLIAVHRSSDGLDWTEEEIPGDLAATDLRTLAARDGRALLGGALSPMDSPEAVLWYDDEASGWQATRLVEGAGYRVASVLTMEGRELVVGQRDPDGAMKFWHSRDQETYAPLQVDWSRDAYVVGAAGEGPLVLLVDFKEIWVASF